MSRSIGWRRAWEEKARDQIGDFELDRGAAPRDQSIEALSERELVTFVEPRDFETVLDAGCGTGANILRLHSRVRKIIGVDYAWGSMERCRRRIQAHDTSGVNLCLASVTALPLSDRSVDKVLCLSVLQYLNDAEVRETLREFARVLGVGGVMVLHVKNLASLYWSTLWVAKKVKRLLRRDTEMYYLRSFAWYKRELATVNCRIAHYNSLNVLMLEGVPTSITTFLQRLELKYCNSRVFRPRIMRRWGADLKIRATITV
jgi:ubiquinone/menaquinone biosynthesis C-methylase UbiE